jgi:hypothetical protein
MVVCVDGGILREALWICPALEHDLASTLAFKRLLAGLDACYASVGRVSTKNALASITSTPRAVINFDEGKANEKHSKR